jgi:hypothetical protein
VLNCAAGAAPVVAATGVGWVGERYTARLLVGVRVRRSGVQRGCWCRSGVLLLLAVDSGRERRAARVLVVVRRRGRSMVMCAR